MPLARRLFLPLVVLLLASCSSIKTTSDYDPSAVAKVDSYRTYAWMPPREGSDPRVYNPLVSSRVHEAVDRELAARGYRKVALNENPDFRIGWQGAIENKLDVQTINTTYGYGWGPWYGYGPYGPGMAVGGAGYPQTYVEEYQQGSLILDVVDNAANKLVWRGSAQARLAENPSAEKRQERIDKAVHEMLEKFPPEPKK
jgi:hypothetical protein